MLERILKLFKEFPTTALTEFDTKPRFLAQFARGNPERVLALCNKKNKYRQLDKVHE